MTASSGGELELGDETMDIVYSYQFLPHVSNEQKLKRIVLEMGRVLRPGGLAIAHVGLDFLNQIYAPNNQTFLDHLNHEGTELLDAVKTEKVKIVLGKHPVEPKLKEVLNPAVSSFNS